MGVGLAGPELVEVVVRRDLLVRVELLVLVGAHGGEPGRYLLFVSRDGREGHRPGDQATRGDAGRLQEAAPVEVNALGRDL